MNVQVQPSNRPAALNKSNDQRKVLVNSIKEVGLSLTLLIKIYILIDRYTDTGGSTEVTYFFTREVPSSRTESSNCRLRKCERRPSILNMRSN